MGEDVHFDGIISALNDATFDDAYWPMASAQMDRVCGSGGNGLFWGEVGPANNLSVYFARCCSRGERRVEFEEAYFRDGFHLDERISRLGRLPDGKIVHLSELYNDKEMRGSVVYNEMLARSGTANWLHARLDGPGGSMIIWTSGDPVDDAGWTPARVQTIGRLLPHIRHFVRVRQTLADARAFGATALLENTRCGVVQLDRRGRIVEVNPRAMELLRQRDGLLDTHGYLRARNAAEDSRLWDLLKRSLPAGSGEAARGGSMTISRLAALPPRLVLQVTPSSTAWEGSRVAAIVLIAEPEMRSTVDPELVAEALGLTVAESRLASMLAAGHTPKEIAVATGRSTGTVRWHIRQIYEKNQICRQTELVHLIRSLSVLPENGD